MLFEALAKTDDADQERIAGTRAIIATQERVKTQFSKFVAKARNDEDLETRLAMIDDQLLAIAATVADEYQFDNVEHLYLAGTAVLGGGHKPGCECGFCKNKGKLPGSKKDEDSEETPDKSEKSEDSDDDGDSKKPWEKDSAFATCSCGCEGCDDGNHCESDSCISTKHTGNPGNKSGEKTGNMSKEAAATAIWHTADVASGDTFSQETVDLGASETGLGEPSPKIDKSRVPDGGLKPIDVPSKQHPSEEQAIHQTPEYWKDLPGTSETGKEIDADKPLQPEHNTAPNTDTWTGTEGLASPVTSRVAKWSVVAK